MTLQVLRFLVQPDAVVEHQVRGRVVHVAATDRPGLVNVYAEDDDTQPVRIARFMVYVSGEPIPDGARHVGTAVTGISPGFRGALVSPGVALHVYELAASSSTLTQQDTTDQVGEPCA